MADLRSGDKKEIIICILCSMIVVAFAGWVYEAWEGSWNVREGIVSFISTSAFMSWLLIQVNVRGKNMLGEVGVVIIQGTFLGIGVFAVTASIVYMF